MTEATTTAPVETKNEAVPELMPDPITFTDAAVAKVKSLMDEEGNPDLKLRVFVQGGGCAGFQYGFTFDETQNDDDAVMQKGGVTLLIDSMSYQYLVGAKIDYKEGLSGEQFVIDNPNAVTTWLRIIFLGLSCLKGSIAAASMAPQAKGRAYESARPFAD